jgi:cytosine permease
MIADLYFVRPGAGIAADWRPKAFIAWAVGSLVAYGVETFMPQLSTAVSAFVAAGVCYFALNNSAETLSRSLVVKD